MRSTHRNDDGPNSVLGRAFTLLTAFRPGDAELTLAELHRRTGIAKPTALRLLTEMGEWEVVERTAGSVSAGRQTGHPTQPAGSAGSVSAGRQTGRPTQPAGSAGGFRLGMRLFELGQLVPRQRGLAEAAAPMLADLFEATHETVHLAVLDGTEVVYVQKYGAASGPRIPSRIGGRMPAYCTGVGKAMLAFLPPEQLRAVFAAGLPRRTPRTVIAPGLLERELAGVRERGVAEEHEESAVGIACVAAPVLTADGRPLAAISITGWANRLDTNRLAAAVRTAALGLARTLRA